MITVSGANFDISTIAGDYPETGVERQVLDKMSASRRNYGYDNLSQLKFELNLRKETVNAAEALNVSGLSFANFDDSKCNRQYWDRTENGGFRLANGAKPGEAISDIYINGDKYATECATAMQIVYYKALLGVYGEKLFDKLFPKIYLMNWMIREPLLKDLGSMKKVTDSLIGDRGYFVNEDVDPKTPEWQGENVIVLPDSLYYGHGIGIKTADEIIEALNLNRKRNATQSAYLLDSAARPDFKELSEAAQNNDTSMTRLVWKPFPLPISPL